jgi:hypothetical protein
MRVRFFGTEAFRGASPRKVDFLIKTAIGYVWRARKPQRWPDARKRRRGQREQVHWRAAAVLLIFMYNLRISYRGMEGFLDSRPGLLGKLGLRKAPRRMTLNNAYWRFDHEWFWDLNKRIAAHVENEEKRRKARA